MAIKIGKFDIFATYKFAEASSQGMPKNAAKAYGYSIAVLGAQAKMGTSRGGSKMSDSAAIKKAAEKKKKSSITHVQFDLQIEQKMGDFFGKVFYPTISRLVKRGLSYDQVKALVAIPPTWGAKITDAEFVARTK